MIGRRLCYGRSELNDNQRQPHPLASSFRYAGRGLWLAFCQRNFRFHLLATVSVLFSGWWFGISPWQWGLLTVAITLVVAMEIINTAVEYVVDLASPGYAELARMAKDVAAGAVLITALAALALGNLIFAPSLAPWLMAARDSVARLSAPMAVGIAISAGVLQADLWFRANGAERRLLCLSLAAVPLWARLFVAWPSLPLITGLTLLSLAMWARASGWPPVPFLARLPAEAVFWLWFWQQLR